MGWVYNMSLSTLLSNSIDSRLLRIRNNSFDSFSAKVFKRIFALLKMLLTEEVGLPAVLNHVVIHFIPLLNQLFFDRTAHVEACVAIFEVALNAAANLSLIFPFAIIAG